MDLELNGKAALEFGASQGVDLLVNNAGAGVYTPLFQVGDEDLLYAMSVTYFAPYRIYERLVPLMVARGGGSVVNISGASGNRVTHRDAKG